ncbi:MAG: hypothetical protein B7X02_00830 [Rhodospirillales bacterium 12-54-5]|nr:MAG: hypothetical protein B7X02_00830 [Rhodospirillales bacterium 12-54-5]
MNVMHAQRHEVSTGMNISAADIDALVREPSSAMRSRIVEKIAVGYHSGLFSSSEMTIANEIFRLLVRDTERRVRQLLAEQLKSSMQVPHDIALALANDVSHEVAVPMLTYSHVLSEQDLLAIVEATREHPRLMAIAGRDSLSQEVSHALVEKRDPKITKKLLANRGASLADATIQTVLDEFARDNSVLEELVVRGGLPYAFAEKLFAIVSDAMKKQLTQKYRMKRELADDSSSAARETATLQFLSPWMSQNDINKLIDEMDKQDRLTDSVIIRSLCIGDLRFFETAIAKRAGIPPSNARILIVDPGPLGFKGLYHSCGLPENFYEAVHTMLKLAHQETEYGKYRTHDFGQIMVHSICRHGYDKTVKNMDALLGMINIANATNLHAMPH